MKKKFLLIATAVVCIFIGIYLIDNAVFNEMLNPPVGQDTNCTRTSDCDWVITNCCKETAGGVWECVNLKTYKQAECQPSVICPQVFSPKPTAPCICKEGSCVHEA